MSTDEGRHETRLCTVDGCSGTMTYSARAIPGDEEGFMQDHSGPGIRPDQAGWVCEKNPKHTKPLSD